ncbi:MAG: nuclear transport factor 2 family protein [Gammaproteobacteria bacterium]|nr:nuclear transport factor 2 family protein [Gammaproteobacteria bacterium]
MTLSASPDLTRRALLRRSGTGLLAATALPAVAAEPCVVVYPRARYQRYLTLFNANDPGYADFYHEDVVLELGTSVIRGRQGILDFYTNVKRHIRESLQLTDYIADANGIAAEVPTEFVCFNDWPDSFWNRPLKRGEVLRLVSFAFYRVIDGRFAHIKSARYRLLNDWRMESPTA